MSITRNRSPTSSRTSTLGQPLLPLELSLRLCRVLQAAVLLHPKSIGQIKLFSPDPFHHPLIQANYLSHEVHCYSSPLPCLSEEGRCPCPHGRPPHGAQAIGDQRNEAA